MTFTETAKQLRVVAYYPALARIFGIKAGLLLCQILWHQNKDKGLVFKTSADLEQETALTYKEQIKARQELRERGVLVEKISKESNGIFFQVDGEKLDAIWHERHPDPLTKSNGVPPDQKAEPPLPTGRGGMTKGKTPPDQKAEALYIEKEESTEIRELPLGSGADSEADIKAAAKGAHKRFTELWCEGYEEKFGRRYVHGGGKDGKAITKLLTSSGQTPEALMEIASDAWKHGHLFNCKAAASISGFAARFNDICAELTLARTNPKESTKINRRAENIAHFKESGEIPI